MGSYQKIHYFMPKVPIVQKKVSSNPACLQVKSQRYQLTTTLIPSMYGGILALDGAVTDPGLGISLPGRYQLQQVDEQTVKGQVINYSGCEDNDFAFHFILRFWNSCSCDWRGIIRRKWLCGDSFWRKKSANDPFWDILFKFSSKPFWISAVVGSNNSWLLV